MYMFKSFLKPWYGILFEHQEFLMQGLDKLYLFVITDLLRKEYIDLIILQKTWLNSKQN